MLFGVKGQAVLDASSQQLVVTQQGYFEDNNCSLTYYHVNSAGFQHKFNTQFKNSFDGAKGSFCYWLKFKLQNKGTTDGEWLIDFDKWDHIEAYFTNDSTILYQKNTGYLLTFKQRDFPLANRSLISFSLKSGDSIICYAKVRSEAGNIVTPENLSFKIQSQALVLQQQTLKLCLICFFFGIYVIMLLYNLFIYFSIRERSYLYYLALLCILILALFDNSGYSVQLFKNVPHYPYWIRDFDIVYSSIFGTVILLFASDFLKLKQNIPWLNKSFYAMIIFLALLTIPVYTGYRKTANNISSLCGLITVAMVLLAAIKSYNRKYPSSSLFLLAYGIFVIGIGVFLLKEMGILPSTLVTQFGIEIGSSAEAVLFSLALADRINHLKKQNEASQVQIIAQLNEYTKLQENINRDLEEKVEQRTKELKESQQQLLQKEKLAALGELTAGIAHEIQNPLNFVNNFSEVNAELLKELDTELDTGNYDEVRLIAGDIRLNQQKIIHHGKRADNIVKGMMMHHSNANTGQKEPVNINHLAEEYLKLSYHGFRTRDKTFRATIKTDYDESMVPVNVMHEEFGRTLLNIYNNAFYALSEKRKLYNDGFEPGITITTRKLPSEINVSIRDNGTGIPAKILNKIFQPFFTTKPTGEGTGLGLSLCYDAVKAQGGEITVNTEEGEFTEFVIVLPL